MRLRYTVQARDQIAAIYSYISNHNPEAARQVIARIRSAAERLTEFPRIGRAGRVTGTFEWVARGLPYIIVYEPAADDSDEILILGVFHGAQNREPK